MTSPIGTDGRRRGLTLVEILVSVAILAGGAVVVMQALARGAHTLDVARVRLQAQAFSSAKMADVEMSLRQGLEPRPRGQFQMGRRRFRWKVQATPIPEEPQLQLVTLTVTWRQGRYDYASHLSTVARVAAEEDVL